MNVNIKISMRNHQPLTVATWNVRTLLDFSEENPRLHRRTAIVAHELKRYNIDIAALSKTRLSEDNLIEKGEGYTFFWKGYPENVRRNHGVGFAIRNEQLKKIETTPAGIS